MPAYAMLAKRPTKVSFQSKRYIGLGAAQATPEFTEQLAIAQGALSELTRIASTISKTTTDPGIKNAADIALQFTSDRGPRVLNDALVQMDPKRIISVQTATINIIKVLKPEILPAILERFAAMIILGPAGAFVTPDQVSTAKEAGRDLLPDALNKRADAEDLARMIKLALAGALGCVGLVSIAYFVRAFK